MRYTYTCHLQCMKCLNSNTISVQQLNKAKITIFKNWCLRIKKMFVAKGELRKCFSVVGPNPSAKTWIPATLESVAEIIITHYYCWKAYKMDDLADV